MRRELGNALIFFGILVLGTITYFTIEGIRNPSASWTVAVALLGAIGVPVGLSSAGGGWRLRQDFNAEELRAEAEAKLRAATALDHAATAERIRSELNAYVELRARRLEVDRRRTQLEEACLNVVELHGELTVAERQLGLEASQLDPQTIEVLDQFTEEEPLPFRSGSRTCASTASLLGRLPWPQYCGYDGRPSVVGCAASHRQHLTARTPQPSARRRKERLREKRLVRASIEPANEAARGDRPSDNQGAVRATCMYTHGPAAEASTHKGVFVQAFEWPCDRAPARGQQHGVPWLVTKYHFAILRYQGG